MSHTISPRQDDSVKRRRVLSDLVNTGVQPIESHTRRKSIGFDLVRILSPDKSSESKQPDSQNIEMNTRGSSIPTLRNHDRYEKLLNISESLNRKSKVNNSAVFTPANVSQSKQVTDKLMSELETLNEEIRLASDELAAIDDEYSHQNMLYRALKTEMAELHNVLRDNEAKFEYMLAQTTSQVDLKKKELEVSLREYKTTRENSYNNTKFELENELHLVSQFDDTESIQSIEKLRAQRSELQSKLKQQLELNEKTLQETEQEYSLQFKEKEKESSLKISSAEDSIRKKEETLQTVLLELSKAQEVLVNRQQSDAELERQIGEKKNLIESFTSTQIDWQDQLTKIKGKLRNNTQTHGTWDQEVENYKRLFEEQKKKQDQYQQTRRTLEHAISRYGSSRRVYVKSQKTPENENELFELHFNKVVGPEEKDFSKEWELHAQECLRGSLVALVFAGTSINCLEQLCICLSYLISGLGTSTGSSNVEIFIQSVRFDGHRSLDLLNRSNDLVLRIKDGAMELISQRMTVTGINDINTAFKSICLSEGPTMHFFTIVSNGIDAKFQSSLCLVDLSKFSLTDQAGIFEKRGTNNELNSILDHILTHFKSLTVCELDDIEDDKNRCLLKAIHHREL